ncbi:hypothetical protein AAHE18_19G030100 [Arachis hypogaea]
MAKLKMANLFTLFLLLSVTGEVDVGRMRSCRDDNWHGFNCEIETACYEHCKKYKGDSVLFSSLCIGPHNCNCHYWCLPRGEKI